MSLLDNPMIMARLAERIKEVEREKDSRRFDAAEIAAKIRKRVIGQDQLADRIATFIARKGARRTRRGTLANILVAGPTGTGKTETAKAVSEAVFGSEEFMLQVDCGSIGSAEHSIASLAGSPRLWQRATRGALADYLSKTKGEGVILFDEFEKAAPTPQAPLAVLLLKLMDEAKYQTPYDLGVYEATSCVVILTSNLKQRELAEISKQISDPDELELATRRVLSDSLAPEFLERLDLVTTTMPLAHADQVRIVMLQFEKLARSHEVAVVDVRAGFFDMLLMGAEKFGHTSTRGVGRWLGRIADDAFIDAVNEHHWRRVIADWDGASIVLAPTPNSVCE